METIKVKDKRFELLIPAARIDGFVEKVAAQLNHDYKGKQPLFVAVLNGAYVFAADLLRKINIPCNITFVKFTSYVGMATSSKVTELIGLNEDLKGRHIVLLEDIIDTGITMDLLLKDLPRYHPADVRVACLFHKPAAFSKTFKIQYIGESIPNDFIVGYGLDYDGFGRNLPDIYKVVK